MGEYFCSHGDTCFPWAFLACPLCLAVKPDNLEDMKLNVCFCGKLLSACAAMALAFSCKGGGNGEEPVPSAIDSITITDPSSGTLRIVQGESSRIRYSTVPEVTTAELEWAVDDEGIASVRNGRVTGIAPGTTVVTVSSGDVFAKVDVIVKPIPVESFTLPTSVNAYVDCLAKVSVSVKPAEANAASLTWETDDKDAVEIVMKGGEVWLRALAPDKDFVIRASAEGLEAKTISGKTYAARMTIGGTAKGKWYSPYEDGATVPFDNLASSSDSKLFYMALHPDGAPDPSMTEVSSSDASIVSVSVGAVSTGSVATGCLRIKVGEGTSNGSSVVTVTYDDSVTGQKLSKSITIEKSPSLFTSSTDIYKSFSTKVSDVEEMKRGASLNVFMMDKSTGNSPRAKWTSSNTGVATVEGVSPSPTGYSSDAKITTGDNFGETVITATDESGGTRSFKVSITSVTMPTGTDIGLVNADGSVSKISGSVSLRSTYDKRYSLQFCLIDASGNKISFPKCAWSVTGSVASLSQTTGSETVLTAAYTTVGSTATIKISDDLKSVSKTVSILGARAKPSGALKLSCGDELSTENAKLDFGKTGKLGYYNGTTLQTGENGLAWTWPSSLTTLFTVTQTNGYLTLTPKGVAGSSSVTVTSEQGETATFAVSTAKIHFMGGCSIRYSTNAGGSDYKYLSTIKLSDSQWDGDGDVLVSGKGNRYKSPYLVTQTIYLDVRDVSGNSYKDITWTYTNAAATNYTAQEQTNASRYDVGCIHYTRYLEDRFCKVTATDSYGQTLTFIASVRPASALTSSMNFYYRISENGGSWSSWTKASDNPQVEVKGTPRKVQYKLSTSASGQPATVRYATRAFQEDYKYQAVEFHNNGVCNFEVNVPGRSTSYSSEKKNPAGFPYTMIKLYDDSDSSRNLNITFVDKKN